MAEKTYTEQQNIKYKKKLNELLDILPDFCTQYFDSLEFNKQQELRLPMRWTLKASLNFSLNAYLSSIHML